MGHQLRQRALVILSGASEASVVEGRLPRQGSTRAARYFNSMKFPVAAIAALTTLLAGCGPGTTASSVPVANAVAGAVSTAGGGAASPDASQAAAAAYCTQTHGEVEHRQAVYGSNGSSLLFLAGKASFCQYTLKKDGSRVHILLTTLYTKKPTLAALAYINAPYPTGTCNGNPASCYCTQLGGSDQFGGTTGAGGGWYLKGAIDETLEACVFPDMSSIDSWGLTYHSHGIIRGIDLEKVLRYKYPGGG
jgi:putative hemolysin